MSDHELYVSQSNVFSGFEKPFEKADYVVLGVPFDVTSTYRTGARFMPTAVRQASLNIETYSFRTGLDVEDLLIHDLGDLHVTTDTETTLKRLELAVKSILKTDKTPVSIGGEHTVTLGIMRGLGTRARKTAVISFDAHLDLRDEFMGLRLSHTTFMRRISETVKPPAIFELGTRAVCKEELAYAKKAGIEFFTAQQIRKEGTAQIVSRLKKTLTKYDGLYVSVDMDFLDPAYAPAVQNPETNGLDPQCLLDLLGAVCEKRVVGFDVLEISPPYDQGISATTAARVIFEILCDIEKSRRA